MPGPLNGRPRILVTTDAVGGVWRYALDLAGGLADRGSPTTLAVMGPPATLAQRAEAEAIPGLHLVQTGLPLDWTAPDEATVRHAQDRLHSLAALLGCAAIHLHAPALVGTATWLVPPVVVSHSCVATWWQAVRGGPLPDDLAWRTRLTAEGMANAAATIVPSAAHADAVQAVYGVRPRVVYNGRAPTVLPDRPRGRTVLTAGRLWDDSKNTAALDRVAANLGAPICAAGSVTAPDGGTADFPALHLLGSLDGPALAARYAGAGAYASMARYEPFGLAVLEAAQAGLPLVLSDIPSFRELWDGAALFVPLDDDAALLAALRQALDTPGDLGARARQQAGRYTIDAMVDGTLAVHRGLGVTL